MSANTDDLEQTLVLAAAAADSRSQDDLNFRDYSDETRKSFDLGNEECRPEGSGSFSTASVIVENSCLGGGIKRRYYEEEVSENPNPKSHRNNYMNTRHEEVEADDSSINQSTQGYSEVVATHYNLIEEKGLDQRSKSRIFHLKNFQNWIKSMLINEYLQKIKDGKKKYNEPIMVHDMCAGKGGDLLKWKKGFITHLICSDIAANSVEDCKSRYDDMKQRSRRERNSGKIFSIEHICADCTRVRLREKYSDPSMKLDLVSCQFAFHYSFESLPQAECMMRNASECLQPGGYFIGTLIDANELIARAKRNGSNTFGNTLYNVTLHFDVKKPPLFGAKYHFFLKDAVDCPEFMVHFPTFVKLAKRYGLKLVRKEKFYDFFQRMKHEGRHLLTIMKGLESYCLSETNLLLGTEKDDYEHAREFVAKEKVEKIGTLSKSEWEAISLYTTFAFQKVKHTWNADGTPCYDI